MSSNPAVRAALHTIIRDETRHAELAWQTLAWALAAGGDEARAAVAEAARTTLHPESWDDVIAPSLALLDA